MWCLIGAGIMSATLGVLLKELQPDLTIDIYERLDSAAAESSDAWNNAGTGHSAFCELNYTPEQEDGSIDASKAIKIAESFEQSKQFWSFLIQTGFPARRAQFYPVHSAHEFRVGNGQRIVPPQTVRCPSAKLPLPRHAVFGRASATDRLDAAGDGRPRPGATRSRHPHGHWYRCELRGANPCHVPSA